MLQQILKEMYIDPDVLEALNEEQKKILFLKMRQEQVRRWTEREENFEKESECLNSPKPKQASPKSVSWLLGNDGDVHVCVIGEAAGAKPYDIIHSQVDDKRKTNNHNARAPVSETFQKTERQISTPQEDGIQLNFQTAKKEEDTADPITELKDSGLYYRPHLQHKEPQSLALRLLARDHQEEKEGRDFKIVPAARRPMLSSDSEEANQSPDNPTAQGRVAELRKNFNHLQVTSGKNTLSRVKPPLPAKPTNFQLMSSAGFRSPPQGSTKYILTTKEQAQLSGSVRKLNQLCTAAVTMETREAETEYYIVSPEHKGQHNSDLKRGAPEPMRRSL